MSTELLRAYVPMDRRQALAAGSSLADRAMGSVLLADIAGFTPLTESLVTGLGPRRGAEELTKALNTVYTELVSRVHHFGGSVVCFIGDALLSYFEGDNLGLRALACAHQMQRAMKPFQTLPAPQGGRVSLAMKAAVAAGPVRRFLIGDPHVQLIDVLAGATVDRLAEAEHLAGRNEVITTWDVARQLRNQLVVDEWRGPFGVVAGLKEHVRPIPWPALADAELSPQLLQSHLLPPVYDRVVRGHGEFLAELRPVVALFLRFMGIDYDSDDEAGEKLDAFTVWVQREVSRYGGHVLLVTTADKGSHLYAVFGALNAHEDDGERAVATAMALGKAPSELDFITGMQIGISRGSTCVGAYGGQTRRTYGALGDAVNLAARLMEAAPVGQIRCSEAVRDSARRHWAFDRLPSVRLKGMRRAQPIYCPTRHLRESPPRDERGLIGRRAERATLKRALEDAQSGTRRVLLLEGEAGMGKSRLVGELHRLASRSSVMWLLGSADSMEQHTPYRAWRDILCTLFDLDEQTDPAEQRRRIVERVTRVDPVYEDRAPLLNDILSSGLAETALTRAYDAELRQESLAALVGDLLRATDTPLALTIEDVHWLDSLSWQLALSVARTLTERPILLVLTHRPLSEPVPKPYASLTKMSGAEKLILERLSPEETIALAAARLGLTPSAMPDELAALLAERAGGNPFFAVELVGALRDQGLVVVDEGECSVIGDPMALRQSVPDTLEGVVLSRLGRLPVEEQLTMKVASVIGRSFLLRTLHTVYPKPIDAGELQTHLADTSKRRLTLVETEDPEPTYAFEHAVTQQVAYGTLLFRQRRQLHRNVATWYEETYVENPTAYYPLLVVHWSRAGHAENECRYCRLAGAQAAAQHANAEAVVYYSRALELIDELDPAGRSNRRFDTLRSRANANALLGRVDEERRDLQALVSIANSPSTKGDVLLLWSDFHKRCGRFAEAFEQAETALATLTAAGDMAGEARALTHIGNALEGQSRFRQARERVEEALLLFREINEPNGQAASLKALGVINARLGELPEAMERFNEARKMYRQLNNKKGEADILGNLGALNYYLGTYEKSIEYTQRAQRLFQEMGHRAGSAKCLTNLGNSYAELGAFVTAFDHHRRALDLYQQLEDDNGRADSLCNIGIACQALGIGGYPNLTLRTHAVSPRLDEAIECFDEALAVYGRIGSRRGEALANFKLGSVKLCVGQITAAESHLQLALELSRDIGLNAIAAQSLSALARARLLAGDPERAVQLSTEVVNQLGEASPPEANELHFTHFGVLIASGREDEALRHLELAHRLVAERAETIQDRTFREGFLSACGDILTSWDARCRKPLE